MGPFEEVQENLERYLLHKSFLNTNLSAYAKDVENGVIGIQTKTQMELLKLGLSLLTLRVNLVMQVMKTLVILDNPESQKNTSHFIWRG